MTTIQTLSVKISTDLSSVVKGFDKLSVKAKRLGKDMASVGKTMSAAFTLPILAAGGATIKFASDIEEMRGKFDAVFKETGPEVEAWAKTFSKAVGRSRFDLMEMASSVQDTFVPLGFARKEAAAMSTTLTALAVDVASFNNASESETMQLFTSALVGNHEAVRRYGIVITEATLKQELLRTGANKLTGAALEQAKVQARMNLIFAATSDAQGDAARTSGSFANQMRALQADIKDVSVEIGTVLMPYARELVAWSKEAIASFQSLSPEVKAYAIAAAAATAAIGPLVLISGALVSALGAIAGALLAVVSPIGLTVAALAAIGAAWYLFRDTVDEAVTGSIKVIKLVLIDQFNKMAATFQVALNDLGRAWDPFKSYFSDGVDVRPKKTIADFLRDDLSGDIQVAAADVGRETGKALEREMGKIDNILQLAKKAKDSVSSAASGVDFDLSKNIEQLKAAFEGLDSGAANKPIEEVENGAVAAARAISDEFTKLSVDVRDPIDSIGDSLENGLVSSVNNALSDILNNFTSGIFSGGISSLLGFAGGGRVNAPAMVNERGGETLSSGKGLFIPLGGPATVRNAANSRGGPGSGNNYKFTLNFTSDIKNGVRAEIAEVVPLIKREVMGAVSAAQLGVR